MPTARLLLPLLAWAALACGSPVDGTLQHADTGQLVTIRNYQFLPQSLTVKAGSTVLFRNEDPFPHEATSESAPGAYTPGAVDGVSFDTTLVPALGTRSISVPADAPAGAHVPYYCPIHGAAETQAELVIAGP